MSRSDSNAVWRSERGQTTTEYLMLAGLMVAVALVAIGYMHGRGRCQLARVVGCMLDDYDDCMSTPLLTLPVCPEDLTVHVPKL